MMSSERRAGLWSNPRTTHYSKETQDMMRLMMQESRITSIHRRLINKCLKDGEALPVTFDSVPSTSLPQPKTSKLVQRLDWRPQIRSADACRSGNSYIRENFCPGPTRDLEKEKRRLQNILETGQEEPTGSSSRNVPVCHNSEVVESDRYEEVLNEIEERRQFLTDMAALGREKQYLNIINTEISQKIRELKLLEKTCSPEETTTCGRRGPTKESLTEGGKLTATI
ncbi:UPF0193 protein EVG1 [Antennarius striatus]|uniref:UPF0193 protein EVG1 n=1 Tax=Antennarius striatus TaxID=241820 RepID=UPI0035AFD281